ncbi:MULTISPECIES: hypothetical protein [Virgibacillus]|uniref:DUF3993 domain-containing protein n=2 Tax=Virgibacillus TaxID=84406 RepID=A0A024QAJ3_9BACI|nr:MULTISPECIES: hypothetical protein [Virgibacillus]EQB37251.1 hypothetical protein M948_01580 [Virgibacillus sp. CM-4]GGJ62884.1 hypothetical protein GCM10007111_26260 [Virgibacillus kapii]CDQ39250.1 hypothetical protein BN990_01537 [Virgibacillus massiliensis]
MKRVQLLKHAGVFVMSIMTIFFISFIIDEHVSANANINETPDKNEEKSKETLSHDTIIKRTNQFMDLLVQETDSEYQVEAFGTKEELLRAFHNIATRDAAKPYVDYYYKEGQKGLFMMPTSTPPWFSDEEEYRMIQKNDQQVTVVQENKNNLYGNYIIEIEFTFQGSWKITNIKHS